MKKVLILLTAVIACILLSGCELDEKDLDRANKAASAIGDGVDWVADGVSNILHGLS